MDEDLRQRELSKVSVDYSWSPAQGDDTATLGFSVASALVLPQPLAVLKP